MDSAPIGAMLDVLGHRGPDDRGTASFDLPDGRTAALGHRRLSILDPTPAGHQPMADATGRVHLTYNGEIYNYPELRRELEGRGVPLRTSCDTEVLVNLLALDGLGAVERLNGIFAFAAWDEGSGELWLARDRAGVKPLYHCRLEHGGFAFASEFKALTPLLGVRRPDPRAVADYFTYLWVPGSRTVMAGIDKLEPGHVAVLRPDGSLTQTRYWSLEMRPEGGRDSGDWIEDLSATFDGAVRAQQLSDVPLGSFLSGGLDSSAVVAAMETDDPVTTYTIGSSAADLAHDVIVDDLPYARRLKDELRVDYHETVLTPDLAEQLPRAVWHMDEPVADPAALTTLLICQAASEELTVVMSGVGGDELFAATRATAPRGWRRWPARCARWPDRSSGGCRSARPAAAARCGATPRSSCAARRSRPTSATCRTSATSTARASAACSTRWAASWPATTRSTSRATSSARPPGSRTSTACSRSTGTASCRRST